MAVAAAQCYHGMTMAAAATAVLPPCAAAVAMKTPAEGSAALLAEALR